jgi:predicted RNA-binding Zn-ribbon protein involved in translation (DUF1610 family)
MNVVTDEDVKELVFNCPECGGVLTQRPGKATDQAICYSCPAHGGKTLIWSKRNLYSCGGGTDKPAYSNTSVP